MHTAPAVHLSLEADTPWRVGLCLLCATAAATPAAWLALWLQAPPLGALGVAALAALPALVLPWRRAVPDAAALAWDGAQWWLYPRGQAQPQAGRVRLMMDLGLWLLLRFAPLPAPAPAVPGVRWLALSQSRHGSHWHALRCALHAPESTAPAADAPRRG
jgi:hypothetical protein